MSDPWEDYQNIPAEIGPWDDYSGKIPDIPEPSNLLRRGVVDPLVGLAKGIAVGIPQTVVGLLDIPTMGYAGKGVDVAMKSAFGVGLEEAGKSFDTLLSPETQVARQKVAEAEGFVPTITTALQYPSSIVQAAAENLPTMYGGTLIGRKILSALGLAITAKGITEAQMLGRAIAAGATGEAVITAGQNMEQVRQMAASGTLAPSQVGINLISAAFTGLIGAGGGKLAARLGINDIDTLLAGGRGVSLAGKARSVKGILARIIGGAISEGAIEELPQSIQEQIAQNISLGKPVDEGVLESGAMGMLVGGLLGAVGSGAGNLMARQQQADPQNQAIEGEMQKLEDEYNAVQPSPVIKPEPTTEEVLGPEPIAEPLIPETPVESEVPPITPHFDPNGYATEGEALAFIQNRNEPINKYDIVPREGRFFVEEKGAKTEPLTGKSYKDLTTEDILDIDAKRLWESDNTESKILPLDEEIRMLHEDISERGDTSQYDTADLTAHYKDIAERAGHPEIAAILLRNKLREITHGGEFIKSRDLVAYNEELQAHKEWLEKYGIGKTAKEVSAEGVKPGSILYRGFGREKAEAVYNEMTDGKPLLEGGQFWALSEEDAKTYGPNIETKPMPKFTNPLVIKNDEEWTAFVQKAVGQYDVRGERVSYPNPYGMKPEKMALWRKGISDYLSTNNHDALIVDMEGAQGDEAKTLGNAFGHSQVFIPGVKEAPAPEPIVEPGATSEADYAKQAAILGITFNGMQERLNKPSMPLFTDPETKSTFMIEEGDNLQDKLNEVRKRFEAKVPEGKKVAEVSPVEGAIPPEAPGVAAAPRNAAEVKAKIAEGKAYTITQRWKTKLEEFKNGQRRTLRENRDAGATDVLRNGRADEIFRERRLRDERIINEKVQRELAGNNRERWEGVGYSPSLGGQVEFLAAREHFASLGYETVPITNVPWNGCVDFGTSTVFIGENTQKMLFYTFSHETSHILSFQNNEVVNAIKEAININHPYIKEEMERHGWDEEYTRDEFTAAIVGGMNKPQWVKGDQSANIKTARESSTQDGKPIKGGKPTEGTKYGEIPPQYASIRNQATKAFEDLSNVKRDVVTAIAQYTNPRTLPNEAHKSMRTAFQAQSANEFKWWDSFFSVPFRFSQKYNDPTKGGQWEGAWEAHANRRMENRSEMTYGFLKTGENFVHLQKNWHKEGLNSKDIEDGLEKVERVINAGNIILHERLAALKQQIQGKKGQEYNDLQAKINQIQETRRYSDEELKAGVIDEYGNKIPPLSDREIAAYVAARNGYDSAWETEMDHLTDMTFQKYKKQKWYGILLAAAGTNLDKAETMTLISRKGLNKAALANAKKIRVDIASVFDRLDKGITAVSPEEIADVGKQYEKISTTMATELKTLQRYIGKVTGIKDKTELSELTREVFSAYLLTRPHLKEINRLRNEAREWPGYAPQYRDQEKMKGRLVEKFLDENGDVKVDEKGVPVEDRQVYMKMANNYREGDRVIEEMIALYPHAFGKDGNPTGNYFIEWEPESVSPEAAFQGVSDVNIQKILDDSILNMKARETYYTAKGEKIDVYDQLRNAAFESVANTFKKRGAMRYTLHRNVKYGTIKGYKERGLQKVYINYVTSMAGLMTKQQAAADMLEILSLQDDRSIFEGMAKWNKEQLRNESPADRVAATGKTVAFTYMLGGLLKSTAVNATGPMVMGIPELKKYMREHGVQGMAGFVMLKASYDVLRGEKTAGKSEVETKRIVMEKRLMDEAIRKGVATAQYIQSIFDALRGKFGERFSHAMRLLAWPFSTVEIHNRLSSIVAISRVAYPVELKKAMAQGLTGKEAEEAAYQATFNVARIFNNNVNYYYGKVNRPLVIQSGDLIGVAGSAVYTFKAFPQNLLARQAELLSQGDFRTVAHTMAYMALFGGLMGLPFFKDFFEWYEKKFGYSPIKSIRKTLRGVGGKTLETFGVSGLPAVLGANISGSLNIGLPWPFGADNPADSIFGVMGALVNRGINTTQALGRGDWERAAIELSPEFIRSPLTALKESEIGKSLGYQGFATNPRGNVMYGESGKPITLSTKEAIIKSFGFNPTESGYEREMNSTIMRQKAWAAEQKANITETFRIAKLQKKPTAMKDMLDDVTELNQKIRNRGLKELVGLTSASKIIHAARQVTGKKERKALVYKRAEL